MKCTNCGARLRKSDRFCPSCGMSLDGTEGNVYPGTGVGKRGGGKSSYEHPPIREPLYDEHLYKDSFLEQKREERSQALLITLAVLLLIALFAAGVLTVYFFIHTKDSRPANGPDGGTDWSIQMESGQEEAGVITILDDGVAAGDDSENETGTAPLKTEDSASLPDEEQGNLAAGQVQTPAEAETQQPAETETETEEGFQTKTGEDKESRLDFDEIGRIVSETSGADRFGMCVYDLKQKEIYMAGDAEEPMYATGAVTVPILYAAATLLDAGEITMDDPVIYVNSIGGRGEANPEQRDGSVYPLSFYLTTMLTYSDNNCINVLTDLLGLEKINEICHAAGYSSVDLQRKIVAEVTDGTENYVSAADLGGMLRDLYGNAFKSIDQSFLQEHFHIDAQAEEGTVLGMDEDVSGAGYFLNQNGMGLTRFAEVAYVEDDAHSYIISVMMSGGEGFEYRETGKELSGIVYRSLID